MSVHGRLKRAVRAAIAACGGIEGAAATVEKSTSHVGRWHDLNANEIPSMLQSLAIDEIAVAQGKRPEIVAFLAREMGGVFLPLPRPGAVHQGIALRVVDLAKELGDVSARVSAALRDGECTAREAAGIVPEVNDVIEMAVQLRAELEHLSSAPVVLPIREAQR